MNMRSAARSAIERCTRSLHYNTSQSLKLEATTLQHHKHSLTIGYAECFGTCGIQHIVSRANPFLHQLQDPQPEGMPRCASHDRIDEHVAIGLLCLQHQVMARQEAICWTVALLQQQPALVRSDNYILARLALGRRSRAGKCSMSMAMFYPAETSLSAGGCDNPMICAACRALSLS